MKGRFDRDRRKKAFRGLQVAGLTLALTLTLAGVGPGTYRHAGPGEGGRLADRGWAIPASGHLAGGSGLRAAIGLQAVEAAGPATSGVSPQVLSSQGLAPLPGGGWQLQDRSGSLRLRLPAGTGAVAVTIPEGGPVLMTPPVYRVRVVAAAVGTITHEVLPADPADREVRLEFQAIPDQTTRTRIAAITAVPAGTGTAGAYEVAGTGTGGRAATQVAARAANGQAVTTQATGEGPATGTGDPGATATATGWVRFYGGGNGHRAGMSQYGARGLAKLGAGYQDILRHYYPGTRVERRVNDTQQKVRVGLSLDEQGTANAYPVKRLQWTMKVPANTKVVHTGGTKNLAAGSYNLTYKAGTGFHFQPATGTPGTPFDLAAKTVEVVAPTGGVIELRYPASGYRQYEGSLEFEGSDDGRIIARNKVTLRQYLMGVVPHEMPASWETEGLKAQTVAARTYAARQDYGFGTTLVDSIYDQVFYGRYEDGTSDGRYEKKIADIVTATDGQLLMYNGELAAAYFSSANGGWIAANTEAFGDGTGTPLAYLTGREDRYRLASGATATPESYWVGDLKYESTYFRWERDVAVSVIESKWPEIGSLQSIEVIQRSNTWTPLKIRITGSAGSVEVSGRTFRSKLGLPSPMLLPDKLYPREFPDVEGTVLKDEINRAYQLNLVSGDIYARFHPYDPISRAAFVKMLVNAVEAASGVTLPGPDDDENTVDEPFSDVTPDQALYEFVVKAYKAGYISGYGDGTFGYDRNIKRQEAAAVIARALKLPTARENFKDVPDESAFAGAIGAVSAAGIMSGYSEEDFRPGETMNRAQAAAAAALRPYDYCRANGCSP